MLHSENVVRCITVSDIEPEPLHTISDTLCETVPATALQVEKRRDLRLQVFRSAGIAPRLAQKRSDIPGVYSAELWVQTTAVASHTSARTYPT